jgi:hypothetical protein
MKIANVRLGFHHHLAIKHQLKAQHPMSGRMLRPHRDRHLRIKRLINDFDLWWKIDTGRTHVLIFDFRLPISDCRFYDRVAVFSA